MELTKQQSDEFIKFYKNRYGDISSLPFAFNEGLEIVEWKRELKKILGSKASKLYKIRARGRETVLEKVFNSLWLQYGPTIIEKKV